MTAPALGAGAPARGGGRRGAGGETGQPGRAPRIEAPAARYELRLRRRGPADVEYEIRQLPAPATPHVRKPVRVAGLRGRNLALVEHRVLRRLARAGVRPARRGASRPAAYPLSEDLALPSACSSAPWPRCAAATTWRRSPRASRRWSARKPPTGSAWPCTAAARGAC